MNRKFKFLSLVIVSALFISGCTTKSNQEQNLDLNTVPTSSAGITISPSKTMTDQNPIVSLKTKNGEILIKLYQDKTPKTVANFIKKADSGYYNNLVFHRVIPGFMAQGAIQLVLVWVAANKIPN